MNTSMLLYLYLYSYLSQRFKCRKRKYTTIFVGSDDEQPSCDGTRNEEGSMLNYQLDRNGQCFILVCEDSGGLE